MSAYNPLRDAWSGSFGETFDGSWCYAPLIFGEWKPASAIFCQWELPGQICENSAIANIAIANNAIASKVCKDIPFNMWSSSISWTPCQWVKINE